MNEPIFKPDLLIIPFQLIDDRELEQADRLLYGLIYWYEHLKDGRCFAANTTLASLLHTSPRVVQNSLTKLEERGYIARDYKDEQRRNRTAIRSLISFKRVSPTGDRRKSSDPQVTHERPVGDTASDPQVTRVIIVNKNTKKNSITAPSAEGKKGGDEIAVLIKMFEPVNPSVHLLYSRHPQRNALKRMVEKYGYEKVQNTILAAVQASDKEYAPVITTPIQLESKLGSLLQFYKRTASKLPLMTTV